MAKQTKERPDGTLITTPDVGEGPLVPQEIQAPREAPTPIPRPREVEDLMTKALELVAERADSRYALAEPEEDEAEEEVIFVRNGWLRVVIAGQKCKLRRPFLGELRGLEASMETDTEVLEAEQKRIHEQAEVALTRAREIGEQAAGMAQDDPAKVALDEEAASLAVEISRLSRALVLRAYELREAWWVEVFKSLTPPGHDVPDEMPSWVGDADLQVRVVQHWRAVPLASGR